MGGQDGAVWHMGAGPCGHGSVLEDMMVECGEMQGRAVWIWEWTGQDSAVWHMGAGPCGHGSVWEGMMVQCGASLPDH